MFLNTTMQKPVMAERDLDCVIYIRKYDHVEKEQRHGIRFLIHKLLHKCDPTGVMYTKYYEPYRNVELKPGKTVSGKSKRVYTGGYNGVNRYRIDDGFINAVLTENDFRPAVAYKAKIPAGTEFYLNDALTRVAARKIDISREQISTVPPLETMLYPFLPILSDEIFGTSEDVKPGFYYLSTGVYANPNTIQREQLFNVCGIVSDVSGLNVTIISLDEIESVWCKIESPKQVFSNNSANLTGEEAMLTLMRHDDYGDAYIPARWCSKYEVSGGSRGCWHMGSLNEVTSAIRDNMLPINVAIALLGDKYRLLDNLAYYWTTIDSADEYAFAVEGNEGRMIQCHKTDTALMVRAFMSKKLPDPAYLNI